MRLCRRKTSTCRITARPISPGRRLCRVQHGLQAGSKARCDRLRKTQVLMTGEKRKIAPVASARPPIELLKSDCRGQSTEAFIDGCSFSHSSMVPSGCNVVLRCSATLRVHRTYEWRACAVTMLAARTALSSATLGPLAQCPVWPNFMASSPCRAALRLA